MANVAVGKDLARRAADRGAAVTAPAEGAGGTGYGQGAEIQDLLAHQARVAQALAGLFDALAAIEQRLVQVEAQLRVLVASEEQRAAPSRMLAQVLDALRAHPEGLGYMDIEDAVGLDLMCLDEALVEGYNRSSIDYVSQRQVLLTAGKEQADGGRR